MKRSFFLWTAVSAAVMLLLPLLASRVISGDAGMAACFLLFFAVNPLYSVLLGIAAGKDAVRLWPLPVLSALLFLLGTWFFFDMGEPAFLLYAALYLIIGVCVMLGTWFIRKKIRR